MSPFSKFLLFLTTMLLFTPSSAQEMCIQNDLLFLREFTYMCACLAVALNALMFLSYAIRHLIYLSRKMVQCCAVSIILIPFLFSLIDLLSMHYICNERVGLFASLFKVILSGYALIVWLLYTLAFIKDVTRTNDMWATLVGIQSSSSHTYMTRLFYGGTKVSLDKGFWAHFIFLLAAHVFTSGAYWITKISLPNLSVFSEVVATIISSFLGWALHSWFDMFSKSVEDLLKDTSYVDQTRFFTKMLLIGAFQFEGFHVLALIFSTYELLLLVLEGLLMLVEVLVMFAYHVTLFDAKSYTLAGAPHPPNGGH